jgi:FkbM family methyltransferase
MDLWKPEILSEDDFKRLVSFRPVDMNHVDPDLRGFDFVWSSCSLEHLGTLEQGRRFIFESLRCLRPGGVAVHTTEYNLSSNLDTKEEGPDVIYRRRDLEEIAATLKEQGHAIDIDFGLGAGPLDLHVDRQPFKEDAHLRIEIWGYVCTSFGLIIQKGGSPEAPDVLDLDASTPILLSGAVQDRQTPGAAAVLGKVDLIAPLQVQTATEAISAVRCTIASPGGKPLAIVVDQGAADGITTGLIQGNYSFPSHFAMLFDLAPEGGTVLDLGAHVGTFALMAASAGYRVIAVEASARNAALLEESKRQNGFESMRIVNAAAEDRPGTVQFMDAGPWGRVMTGSDGADVTTAAPAVVIDTLVSEMNLADVTLIKMDIEGSEVAAVRGMTGLLSGPMAPPILFESNALTLALRGQTPADLVASLSDFGYSIYQLALGHLMSIDAASVQIPCVADCLAVRRLPPAVQKRWPVISGLTLEQQIHIALPEMTAPNADQRAYVARILQHLDERLLHERRIIEAMHRLQVDPNPQVRLAIEWWHAPS